MVTSFHLVEISLDRLLTLLKDYLVVQGHFESFTSAPEEGAVWVVTEKDTHGNLFEGSPKKYMHSPRRSISPD